ncbi:methyltransferase domain-containing protein [Ferrovibrio sp.]|uniref:methyltransferase domain-containing protein n=1 Tax=Ferrovibrio sp. TaxID=1917215 RepID=UPI001B646529|nr:methyltransferase domain-containing protein [Ferrovibrio sp.]MBP7063426.1 methyltransferase domain-containing protein [Ferrovibrio sp.]
MDPKILPLLRCPVDGAPLRLETIESLDTASGSAIRTGLLLNDQAKLWYPIVNFVPILLAFPTPLSTAFATEYASRLASHPGYTLPNLPPMPGERSVQQTFTEEWAGLADDELTFIYRDDELIALHRDVWLQMTEIERLRVDWLLNVGVGFGKESRILAELFPNAEVIALDLNLALVAAGETLRNAPRVHPVVASLFRIPFAPATMAHVHSQGVLHHTYSTKAAFDSITRFVRADGSLFIWLYATEDAYVVPGLRGFIIWLYWFTTHRLFRPWLSRSPAFLRNGVMFLITCLLHPLIKLRDRRPAGWRFHNTLHGLRDAFTPRYAHQHGFNEVALWFEEAGFIPKPQSPKKYLELIGKRLLGVGYIGQRRP